MKHFKIASLALCFCFFVSCAGKQAELNKTNAVLPNAPHLEFKQTQNSKAFYWKDKILCKYEKTTDNCRTIKYENIYDDKYNSHLIKSSEYKNDFKVNSYAYFEISFPEGKGFDVSIAYYYSLDKDELEAVLYFESKPVKTDIIDLDGNSYMDLVITINDSGNILKNIIELSVPPKTFSCPELEGIFFGNVWTDKTTGNSYLIAKITNEQVSDFGHFHILEFSNGNLIDISYENKEHLENLWKSDLSNPPFDSINEKILFYEQIGILDENIFELLQLCKDESKVNEIIKTYQSGKPFQKFTSTKQIHIPKLENEYDSNLNQDFSAMTNFKNNSLAYKKMLKIISEKGFVDPATAKKEFFSNYSNSSFLFDYTSKNYWLEEDEINWEIEPDSYWPERKLGKIKLIPLDNANKSFNNVIPSNNLIEGIKNYAIASLPECKTLNNFEIIPFPLSENICLLVSSQLNRLSIVRLDSTNPVIRFWGNKNENPDFNKYSNYANSDPFWRIELAGVCDMNFDGSPDYILNFIFNIGISNFYATHRIFTAKDNIAYEIVIDEIGKIDSFVAMSKRGNPMFSIDNFGYFCSDMFVESDRNYYWHQDYSHQFEIRPDGFAYDVTYKYYGNEYIINKANANEIINVTDLYYFDIMGLSKSGLKAFIKNSGGNISKKAKLVVDEMLLSNKPSHVQNISDVPKTLQAVKIPEGK